MTFILGCATGAAAVVAAWGLWPRSVDWQIRQRIRRYEREVERELDRGAARMEARTLASVLVRDWEVS